MSKSRVAIFFVALIVSSVATLLAQTREPTKQGAGRVATPEEPDFTRFRVVSEQGVLAVFDAEEDYNGRDEPYSQLAYWNDFATEQLYFFNQLLLTEAEEIPCYAILDEIALKIHNLTNVSQAFKKCMMGRLDCRESNNRQYSHPQIRVKCTTSSLPSCGPCIIPPDSEDSAFGCNLGGRHIWYCRPHDGNQTPTQNVCECAEIAFHEAAHACAALDPPILPIDANYSSYRIGCWFLNRCYDLYPNETRTRQDVCGEDNDD